MIAADAPADVEGVGDTGPPPPPQTDEQRIHDIAMSRGFPSMLPAESELKDKETGVVLRVCNFRDESDYADVLAMQLAPEQLAFVGGSMLRVLSTLEGFVNSWPMLFYDYDPTDDTQDLVGIAIVEHGIMGQSLDRYYIHAFVVNARYQRKRKSDASPVSYAHVMMVSLLTVLRMGHPGIRAVELHVASANTAAVRLFERIGFSLVETRSMFRNKKRSATFPNLEGTFWLSQEAGRISSHTWINRIEAAVEANDLAAFKGAVLARRDLYNTASHSKQVRDIVEKHQRLEFLQFLATLQ